MKRIGLVLSGGGARGLAHTKALEVFDDLGIKPHIIVGSSMGALVAGAYAAGHSPQRIAEDVIAENVTRIFNPFDVRQYAFSRHGLLSNKNLRAAFARSVDDCDMTDLDIKTKIIAKDFETGKKKVFSSGSLHDAVTASISIPGIFNPTSVQGRLYVDGGVSDNLPVADAVSECDHIIAIDVTKGVSLRSNRLFRFINKAFLREKKDLRTTMPVDPSLAHFHLDFNLTEYSVLDWNKGERILELSGRKVEALRQHLIELIGEQKDSKTEIESIQAPVPVQVSIMK